MDRIFCPHCRLEQPRRHTFCIACGSDLPVHLLAPRTKRARFFAGMKVDESDPEGAFLRVSCYRKDQVFESPEGSVTIPGRHVRFSVWVGTQARCVLSIPESEAVDLARFLSAELATTPAEESAGRQSVAPAIEGPATGSQ